MRRLWITYLLPAAFCLVPLATAAAVFAAVPSAARGEYLIRLRESSVDWIILGLGGLLFLAQTWISWRCLRWKGTDFDESRDPWLSHLAQGAEWFPLLGLIGTVAAILQTFGTFGSSGVDKQPTATEIIRNYGPAITATGSGLFMAFLNILPSWTVVAGRKLIRSMAGAAAPPGQSPVVPLTPVGNAAYRQFPPAGDRA